MFQKERYKLLLIAYIHNGDCCDDYDDSGRGPRKIASLMPSQHERATLRCHNCYVFIPCSPVLCKFHDPKNKIRRNVVSL